MIIYAVWLEKTSSLQAFPVYDSLLCARSFWESALECAGKAQKLYCLHSTCHKLKTKWTFSPFPTWSTMHSTANSTSAFVTPKSRGTASFFTPLWHMLSSPRENVVALSSSRYSLPVHDASLRLSSPLFIVNPMSLKDGYISFKVSNPISALVALVVEMPITCIAHTFREIYLLYDQGAVQWVTDIVIGYLSK